MVSRKATQPAGKRLPATIKSTCCIFFGLRDSLRFAHGQDRLYTCIGLFFEISQRCDGSVSGVMRKITRAPDFAQAPGMSWFVDASITFVWLEKMVFAL